MGRGESAQLMKEDEIKIKSNRMNIQFIRLNFLVVLVIAPLTVLGQNIEKCDGSVLLFTSQRVGVLKQKEIRNFLLTFDSECRNNVEYSQWSNELLFLLLDKQTDLTLKTIMKYERIIEMEEILDKLSNPITDLNNLPQLADKVMKASITPQLKSRIVNRLELAIQK